MKIIDSMGSGFDRTLKVGKGVMIVWFTYLIVVCLIAFPLKISLYNAFRSSMITERFSDGIDIEAISDLGPVAGTIRSFLSSSLIFLLIPGFLLNVFLTGGLFTSLRSNSGKFLPSQFFLNSAKSFWSFLIISVIIAFLMILTIALLGLIPAAIVASSEGMSEKNAFFTMAIGFGIILLTFIPFLFLIADYSKARKVSTEGISVFRALGFGFSQTFRKFWLSWPLMLTIGFVQLIFLAMAFLVIAIWKPDSGIGVILLFLVSQFLVLLRFFLKTWRYGSVTSLMELTQIQKIGNNDIKGQVINNLNPTYGI